MLVVRIFQAATHTSKCSWSQIQQMEFSFLLLGRQCSFDSSALGGHVSLHRLFCLTIWEVQLTDIYWVFKINRALAWRLKFSQDPLSLTWGIYTSMRKFCTVLEKIDLHTSIHWNYLFSKYFLRVFHIPGSWKIKKKKKDVSLSERTCSFHREAIR